MSLFLLPFLGVDLGLDLVDFFKALAAVQALWAFSCCFFENFFKEPWPFGLIDVLCFLLPSFLSTGFEAGCFTGFNFVHLGKAVVFLSDEGNFGCLVWLKNGYKQFKIFN